MDNKLIASVAVTALVVGGGAFFGGMKFQEMKSPAGNRGFAQMQGQMGQMGQGMRGANGAQGATGGAFARGGMGGGLINGEVVSKDDSSITLKLTDGGSKIVFFNSSTTVSKQSAGSMSDIAAGTNLFITGKTDKDGSVTASMLQIRPAGEKPPEMRMMGATSSAPVPPQN